MQKIWMRMMTIPCPYEMIVKNHHLYGQLHKAHNQDYPNLLEWKNQLDIILSPMKLKKLQLENK